VCGRCDADSESLASAGPTVKTLQRQRASSATLRFIERLEIAVWRQLAGVNSVLNVADSVDWRHARVARQCVELKRIDHSEFDAVVC